MQLELIESTNSKGNVGSCFGGQEFYDILTGEHVGTLYWLSGKARVAMAGVPGRGFSTEEQAARWMESQWAALLERRAARRRALIS